MSATYVTAGHLDDFALLRFVAADLSEFENGAARRHLRTCDSCRSALQEIEVLDAGLRQVTDQLRKEHASREMAFPGGDPFRRRPRPRPAGASGAAGRDPALIDVCRDAAQDATPRRDALLAAALESDHALRDSLHALRLTELTDRYALGYGLDAALGRMVEAPARWLALGDAATARVRRERRLDSDPRVERAVPLAHLRGAARLLSGAACNWTGDLERGGRELAAAWRAFAAGDLSSMRLAEVEVVESQRRTFLERAAEGLVLAERAEETFDALDLTEKMARARGAQALALSYLGREEEALERFRGTLGVLAELGIWNMYVTALNGVGTCLLRLGRPREARREYARALRLVSRTERPAVHAFIRSNLARTLLQMSLPREAARAFHDAAALFERQGALADALTATLFEVECLGRMGAREAACSLFERFEAIVRKHEALDSTLLGSLRSLIAGEGVDVDLFAAARLKAEEGLRARLRTATI